MSLTTKLRVALVALLAITATQPAWSVDWPEPTPTSRPWTRWWWHGSAVDEANLTRLLEEYRRVGIGGVEVTCIYGVMGEPHPNRRYLSAEWRDAIRHTIDEASRLGMGVDLPAGSGWRMGDPELPASLANSRLVLKKESVQGPGTHTLRFDGKTTPQAVVARSTDGEVVDLTDRLEGNELAWDVPPGEWRIDSAGFRWSGDRVKRPGPGGEGLNINPFWRRSVEDFLTRFSKSAGSLAGVRSQFHDSFEYDGDWQPHFFEEFETRRGYRLEEHLAELAGEGDPERVGRIKADYRQTLEDLVREDLIGTWVEWSHSHGMLARNQSHGSPANWLDLYAAVDIPEIESFGPLEGGDADPLMLKFASSAANVTGKRLVSSETATWLDEHFHVTLDEIKQIVDRQVLAGVNHVFYHGTAYSPADAAWPGWLFYASTQLNPQNPIWRDFPALNQYVTRVQSVLQASRPDTDVLLYWPLLDLRHSPRGLRQNLRVHNSHDWFSEQPIGAATKTLHERGLTFDYVSDRLLADCEAEGSTLRAPGGAYRAVVVPKAVHLPQATVDKLAAFARAGVPVVFWGGLPESLPGLRGASDAPQWREQRDRFDQSLNELEGSVLRGEDLSHLLTQAELSGEGWAVKNGVGFIRRHGDEGTVYFLCNQRDEPLDAWIDPHAEAEAAVLMDPATGEIGAATTKPMATDRLSVRVQLEPKETLLLVLTGADNNTPPWAYRDPSGPATTLHDWSVSYVDGGPVTPPAFSTHNPVPWTDSENPASQSFAGTARYACEFDAPAGEGRYRLDLGEVLGSATVTLNGSPVGTLIGPTYSIDVAGLKPAGNRLEIDVTGVAANRLRDLDRRGVEWRIFEDINVVGINYKPLKPADWPVEPLGLRGPVRLTPLDDDK